MHLNPETKQRKRESAVLCSEKRPSAKAPKKAEELFEVEAERRLKDFPRLARMVGWLGR